MTDPLEWEREFIRNLCGRPFGRKAWQKLADADLGDITKVILYQYYAFGDSVPDGISKNLGYIGSRLSRLKYATKVDRRHQGDLQTARFKASLNQSHESAANAPWPFSNEQVKTLANAALAYAPVGMLPLENATSVIGVGRQAISRYGGKGLLATLRFGAEANGVRLSLTNLVELADAARQQDPPLINNVLQRFLAQPDILLAKPHFQAKFESLLRQLRASNNPS